MYSGFVVCEIKKAIYCLIFCWLKKLFYLIHRDLW